MIAKCGSIVSWHWAHAARPRCDAWWENETDWHRDWKKLFPQNQQEVIHFAADGEKHIADVKTDAGLVVELQNSPISLAELQSREAFYDNMIWIVNAQRFQSGFHILTPLPPPNSALAQDIYIVRPPRFPFDPTAPGFRLTNRPIIVKKKHVRVSGDGITTIDLGGVSAANSPYRLSLHPEDILNEIAGLDTPYHFLDWRKPQTAWVSATRPVYFDFPGQSLWRLDKFQERYLCVEKVDRNELILKLQEYCS